jgi:molybdopterin-guanine dinucleotide biosynthesis protein A
LNKINKNEITAVILAGGRSSRMGGSDKGLIAFRGKPMVGYACDVARGRVDKILISANRNHDAYQAYGQVIEDRLDDYQGPLAGISAALVSCSSPYLLVLPCDSPLVSSVLIEALIKGMEDSDAEICVAHDGEIMHATFALIKSEMRSSLDRFLASGERKMALWYRQQKLARVDVSDYLEVLVNINRVEDLSR